MKLIKQCMNFKIFYISLILFCIGGCFSPYNEPVSGPDNKVKGAITGAVLGAGGGAVTGFQMGSVGSGPGALVGASFGAIYGMISGFSYDLIEENQIKQNLEKKKLTELAWAEETILRHYKRRLVLYPGRDIFPSDLFFVSDESKLTKKGELLVDYLARLNKYRMPWSRLLIASYIKSEDPSSSYAKYISKQRAENIATRLIKQGIEPRRVLTKTITIKEPLVIDPNDVPWRYNQAIEIIALDR